MSNDTISNGWSNVPNYVIYICQGIFIGGSNLLIVLVIGHYSALRTRKEYLVIAGQALADGLNQIAYLTAGIYRIGVITNDRWGAKITPSECMIKVHSILWLWVYPLSTLMLAVTSLDRLLSVSFPLQYIGWPIAYTWVLLVLAYGYCIVLGLFSAIFVAIDGDEQVSSAAAFTTTCFGQAGLGWVKKYTRITAARVFPGIAVFLYILVWFQYKNKKGRVAPATNNAEQAMELKLQRKVTISIGVSCLCTLFLWIIPTEIGYHFFESGPIVLATVSFAVANLNPLCNVIIYPLYHQSIRQGIHAYFHRKTMPDDIRTWKKNMEAQKAAKGAKNMTGMNEKKEKQDEIAQVHISEIE